MAARPLVLLLTGAGEETDHADLAVRGFEQLVEWIWGRMAGRQSVGVCADPAAIGAEVRADAVEFADRLAGGSG